MSAEKSAKDISACIRAPCAEENKEDIHYAAAHTVAENNGRKEAGNNNCHQKDKAEMFEREFFFLLDMQLGGKWVGKVEPSTLPVKMEIDWIRVYR
jgi:hypothetical protein